MNYQGQNERDHTYSKFRGSMHIGMGVVYLVFGSAVIYIKYFGSIELPAGMAYAIGSLMVIYGIFRLWRGFVLLRQRKRQGSEQGNAVK